MFAEPHPFQIEMHWRSEHAVTNYKCSLPTAGIIIFLCKIYIYYVRCFNRILSDF